MAIPQDYRKDLAYLQEKSAKHALDSNNAILQKLQSKAKQFPELQRALDSLNINYV
ncbi:hypothetical protein [Arthrobacter sp. SW1]|uniref:hypothetical protein n=1 Tax=Arthrobacter sp. SW1 TaxID=1920889 RepID=UPI00149547D4|nr:hypothetical protein [Arthrobacter sp. SW1]